VCILVDVNFSIAWAQTLVFAHYFALMPLLFFLLLLFLVMEPNSVRVYKKINLHTMPFVRADEHEVILESALSL
jgi:hypothetical protein